MHKIDIDFSVPFTHRLRFTEDVFGPDIHTLTDVLEPSGNGPARVQFWVDADVAEAQPDLNQKLRRVALDQPDRLQLAGNVQLVPGGEHIKNDIHILERMLKVFNAADLDRRSYVVVIGGGAVLDAVGFASAIAHRGIRLVRLPTTTLAQADSGVGVKSAVNLFQKKNWVGAFATPWAVINDTALLGTLPDRDFLSGFSEAVKVSLLKDRRFFEQLCRDSHKIQNRNMDAAKKAIFESARWHLLHITRGGDPYEALEARPLDYGHWSAHKLEVMTDFQIRHGEAVSIGVALDTIYSHLAHGLPRDDAYSVVRCLENMGLPIHHPALTERADEMFTGMEEFRQHLGGRLTLTMLRGVGDPINVHEVDLPLMRRAMATLSEMATASKTA
ncbi:MAG: 3-dehydroquinate synthase [Phycisphaeraceae bacterium]|nr:3-dehydroquinate synthase [Phycisphaeraceae bacterium]